LAGSTIDALAHERISSRRLVEATLAVLALLTVAVGYMRASDRDMPNSAVEGVLSVTVILGLTALVIRASRATSASAPELAYRFAIFALLIVVVWDMTGRWYGEVMPGNAADAAAARTIGTALDPTPSAGAAAFLQSKQATEPPFRYFGYDPAYLITNSWKGGYRTHYRKVGVQSLLVLNRAITLGLDDIQGYDPVQIDRYAGLFTSLNGYSQEYHETNVYPGGISSPVLNLLNARYIIVPLEIPPGRPDLLHLSQMHGTVYGDGHVRVLENDGALDRAWIVHEARVVDFDQGLALLAEGAVDPRTTVLIEQAPPELNAPENPSAEAVSVDDFSPDSMRLTATASAPGMLVVSEAYDPNWNAYVDGKQVDLYVADHAIRAVPIPAGTHLIEFRYESLPLRVGLAISALFTLLALGVAISVGFQLIKRRKQLRSL
jgi:hypothetical protein